MAIQTQVHAFFGNRRIQSLCLLFFAILLLQSRLVKADVFTQDSQFIYKTLPLKGHLAKKRNVTLLSQIGWTVLKNFLAGLDQRGILPNEIRTFEDLKAFENNEKDIGDAMATANRWIRSAQQTSPNFFSGWDTIPDAMMIYVGTKIAKNFGFGGGGSLSIGLIFLPVKVQQFSKATRKLIAEYSSVRLAPVAWISPDVGVGVTAGVGPRLRWGATLIWSANEAFTDPKMFTGLGVGVSSSFFKFVGINLKAGVLNNLDMPGWIDFVYFSAGHEAGYQAGAEFHANGTIVIPLQRIVEVFAPNARALLEDTENGMARDLENIYRIQTENIKKNGIAPDPEESPDQYQEQIPSPPDIKLNP